MVIGDFLSTYLWTCALAGHLFCQSLAESGYRQDGSYLMSNVIELPMEMVVYGVPQALHFSRALRSLLVAFPGI